MEKQEQVKQELINDLFYELLLIKPITEIIDNLKNKKYRDTDVKYLSDKLKTYTQIAIDMQFMKYKIEEDIIGIMNNYNRERFLNYFNVLLTFFKNY